MACQTAGHRSARAPRRWLLLAAAAVAAPSLGWCCWGRQPTASATRAPPREQQGITALRAAEGDGVIDAAGTTKLMAAAHAGDSAAIRELVAAGADKNAQDNYGWTALRYAVRTNHQEAAEALIELGADLNLASDSGRTPLMSAAGNNLSGMVRLLVKKGADRAQQDKVGETAYDKALRGGRTGCTACREMLWFEGAKEHVMSNVELKD
mmetsp:Transcript_82595/g.229161  ORF Transcript_82595/g.229161 Transcript_82595/m.229161 type:complete len:209 (+) Transcript_82595:41-667(+)